MRRLPRRNLGSGVYHIYNRCANNLWSLDSQECKNKFLELLERLSGKYELNIYHYCVNCKCLIESYLYGMELIKSKIFNRGNAFNTI